jgi:sec-independent protein translocase protein TatA
MWNKQATGNHSGATEKGESMFGLGIPELIVIFIIALVVFGPKKLPELGKSIGRAMAEFKKASEDFQESVRTEMREVEREASVKEDIKRIEQNIEEGTKIAEDPAVPEGAPGATTQDGHAAETAYEEKQKERRS